MSYDDEDVEKGVSLVYPCISLYMCCWNYNIIQWNPFTVDTIGTQVIVLNSGVVLLIQG